MSSRFGTRLLRATLSIATKGDIARSQNLLVQTPCKRFHHTSLPPSLFHRASGGFGASFRSKSSSLQFTRASLSSSCSQARTFFGSASKMSAPDEISDNKHFGGHNKRYQHESKTLGCPMKFHLFFPPSAATQKVPVIYWLSGLTCTDENFIQKSGAQRMAAEKGVAIVAPDTSPRGLNIEGESDSWDFGVGAGFYLNATVDKWKNWRMYDYITEELPMVLAAHFPTQLDTSQSSIMGHSMGGHGALVVALKNPGKYKAVSAFSPICNPMECPWGVKAFTGYLGDDKESWAEYDATVLVKKYRGPKLDILIDQGDKDNFYIQKQLLPEHFQHACEEAGLPLTLRFQGGYDHSYFFISSFIDDHISLHAKAFHTSGSF
eukprot:TRINITY_DN19432_c0_g1_i1.p1 TRINITY_DN19432_c0_g1~~TRINITY_DN19432_c0_g1_i1.p1  ORF type:complete len:377 (-),score=61.04 TRINITY_DN19432_c0_g1_i1:211-1341(-)